VTDTLAARPTPLSRIWAGSKIIAEDIEGEDLADVLELHADASAWWVMPRQHQEPSPQLRGAAKALDLDDLAVKDLIAEDRRAKYEELGHARLVMTNAVLLDPKAAELDVHSVSMVITNRAMICLVDPLGEGFDPAKLLVQRSHQLADGGVEAALQAVLGAVINTYEYVVEWLENSSDRLADALFEERPLTKSEQLWAFKLRTVLSQLRRLTDPMRAVMNELVESQPEDSYAARKWIVLQEQHQRVANAADALREALSSVFDTSLALADLRMNAIMKKLTGWAGIIAVPTLVSGFVGMNVTFPLDGTSVGFWVYTLIMLIAVVVLYVAFRRKDWI
jgi:magnesium transporter